MKLAKFSQVIDVNTLIFGQPYIKLKEHFAKSMFDHYSLILICILKYN